MRDLAPVEAFETGTNTWRRLPSWPAGCAAGCTTKAMPLYLEAGGRASFSAPAGAGYEEYVSDPAKPVPYIPRPVVPLDLDDGRKAWREWLVSDQRNVGGAAGRSGVLDGRAHRRREAGGRRPWRTCWRRRAARIPTGW